VTHTNDSITDRRRVAQRITESILGFFEERTAKDQLRFRADDLRAHVDRAMSGMIAPGSPDRILRLLRQRGTLNYKVISRSESLYEIVV
jgi:hypothetical protein